MLSFMPYEMKAMYFIQTLTKKQTAKRLGILSSSLGATLARTRKKLRAAGVVGENADWSTLYPLAVAAGGTPYEDNGVVLPTKVNPSKKQTITADERVKVVLFLDKQRDAVKNMNSNEVHAFIKANLGVDAAMVTVRDICDSATIEYRRRENHAVVTSAKADELEERVAAIERFLQAATAAPQMPAPAPVSFGQLRSFQPAVRRQDSVG